MKKRSLLALVLSVTMIICSCTCAFGGIVTSAETTELPLAVSNFNQVYMNGNNKSQSSVVTATKGVDFSWASPTDRTWYVTNDPLEMAVDVLDTTFVFDNISIGTSNYALSVGLVGAKENLDWIYCKGLVVNMAQNGDIWVVGFTKNTNGGVVYNDPATKIKIGTLGNGTIPTSVILNVKKVTVDGKDTVKLTFNGNELEYTVPAEIAAAISSFPNVIFGLGSLRFNTETGGTSIYGDNFHTPTKYTLTSVKVSGRDVEEDDDIIVNPNETKYLITELEGKYKTQGRTSIVNGSLMLDWSATGIEFIADCQGDVKLTVDSSVSHAFFTVIIDNVVQHADLRIPEGAWTSANMKYPFYINKIGESTFVIAEGLTKGEHKIEIYAQNESANGIWGIKSITLEGTFKDAPAQNEKYIEVVGDSIVAGFGNIMPNSVQSFTHHNYHMDATRGWPYLTARALDADWSIMGYSGVCTDTWGGKIWPTMMNCYPLQRHITVDSSTKYKFERQPDVILISLGTNDMAQYSKYTTLDVVEQGYCNFLELLRSKNPDAQIIWLYGMMTTNNSRIISAVESMGGEEKGFYTLELPKDQNGGGAHPSASAQTIYSEKIVEFINTISGDYVPVKEIIPAYDSAVHTDFTKLSGLSTADYVGVENQGAYVGIKMWTDIASSGHCSVKVIDESLIDGATEIYGSGTIKFKSSAYEPNAAYHYVYMPIISATIGENTGYLSLVFRGKGANATLSFVIGSGESTTVTDLITFNQIFTQIGDSHEVKYLLDTENSTLSVQIDGTDVSSEAALPENITVNGVTVGAGMYYAGLQLTDYRVYANSSGNGLGIPVFDAESQIQIGQKTHFYSNYYQPPSTVIDISDKVNGTSTVYTTYTISGKTYLNGYHGSMVYLAAAGNDIWALRLIDDHGWCLGKAIEEGYTADGTYLIVNANYPNGTQIMSALTITVKTEGNKVTVWMSDGENEIIALNNYELPGMTGAAVGMDSFGSGASITAKTWVDNENYAYLGDLNGDQSINVLDYILAVKLSANESGVTAFNDAVKAFNQEGTIDTAELIKMKKYLLGVIDKF